MKFRILSVNKQTRHAIVEFWVEEAADGTPMHSVQRNCIIGQNADGSIISGPEMIRRLSAQFPHDVLAAEKLAREGSLDFSEIEALIGQAHPVAPPSRALPDVPEDFSVKVL